MRSDMVIDGNGDVRLQAHQYINVNDVDYGGSNTLQLDIAGKNNGARGVATVLGVNAEAGINLEHVHEQCPPGAVDPASLNSCLRWPTGVYMMLILILARQVALNSLPASAVLKTT